MLRRATAADAAAIATLTRTAYAKWVPLIGREPLPMTADHAVAVREHVIDLWEEDGCLIALIEMIPGAAHLAIENLAVAPDRQGAGHGGRLLAHAEAVAVTLGLGEVRLYTNAAFAANLAFYARRGYRQTGREELVPGSVAVHMAKTLAGTVPPGEA